MFEAEAEAKILASSPLGLEDLTSLSHTITRIILRKCVSNKILNTI